MVEPRSIQSAIEDAEKAAGGGDYVAAERLLREAASRQEASLGELHPDLANTLNNLAVVYETLDRPSDAERCYRRAYTIAVAALAPDHAFVATSEKNYRDFCGARGIPFVPVRPPARARAPEPLAPPASDRQRDRRVDAKIATIKPSIGASHVSRSGVFGVMVIVAAVAAVVAGPWAGATPPPADPVPAVRGSSPIHPAPVAPAAAPAPTATQPIVDEVRVCRELSTREWRCRPATPPVAAGSLFFYTRIKSPTSATVEHRWYRDDRLQRVVPLRVQANQPSGYRTYSRTKVSRGHWRVEVRTKDGGVLRAEHFVVQ
jgi:hypothetical protein